MEAATALDLAPRRNWQTANFETLSRAAVAVLLARGERKNDRILLQKNLLERVPIASITKLMTAIVALDYDEALPFAEPAVISRQAATTEGQSAGLMMGERLAAQDLLGLMLVASANDAAVALAEHVGQVVARPGEDSVAAFVRLMNDHSRMLGLTDTSFANPAGLDDPNNYSTAADLVELVKISRQYPAIWAELAKSSLDIASLEGRKHHVQSTDDLLGVLPGFEGGKTGFTSEAGGSMVAVTRIGPHGEEVVTVVLGSADRFGETRRLIEWLGQAYLW